MFSTIKYYNDIQQNSILYTAQSFINRFFQTQEKLAK